MKNVIDIQITTVEADKVLDVLRDAISDDPVDGPVIWFRNRLLTAYRLIVEINED